MKLLLTLTTILTLVLFSVYANGQQEAKKVKGDKEMPYKATHSSQWSIGDVKYANTVLTITKAVENNTLDNIVADLFADNFQFVASDGTVIKGKDEYLSRVKKIRDSFTYVKTTILSYLPVHSTDKNENAVLVWGTNELTDKSGNNRKVDLHWNWVLDQNGKVVFLRDYTSKPYSQQ